MAFLNYVSAAAFLVIVVFHFWRVAKCVRLVVGEFVYPVWLSLVEAGIALVLAGLLVLNAR